MQTMSSALTDPLKRHLSYAGSYQVQSLQLFIYSLSLLFNVFFPHLFLNLLCNPLFTFRRLEMINLFYANQQRCFWFYLTAKSLVYTFFEIIKIFSSIYYLYASFYHVTIRIHSVSNCHARSFLDI